MLKGPLGSGGLEGFGHTLCLQAKKNDTGKLLTAMSCAGFQKNKIIREQCFPQPKLSDGARML